MPFEQVTNKAVLKHMYDTNHNIMAKVISYTNVMITKNVKLVSQYVNKNIILLT